MLSNESVIESDILLKKPFDEYMARLATKVSLIEKRNAQDNG